jgi:hypothetical protein
LHAIPWSALQVGADGQITWSATPAQLKAATGFSNDNWPSEGNSQWLRSGAAAMG